MTHAAVRAQIVSYLETNASTASGGNNTIPFLNVVYGFPPKFTPEGQIMGNSLPDTWGINSGSIIYLYFPSSTERQIEFRGTTDPNGKFVYYDLHLICVMFSEHAESEDAGADNETFIDGLRQAVRNSKNAGGTGAVFSWGQGNQTGSNDINITMDLPQQMNGRFGRTYVYSLAKIQVLEDLTG